VKTFVQQHDVFGGAFFVPIKEIRREAVVYPVKLKDVEPSVRFLTDEV
jgi:hypothetical protein